MATSLTSTIANANRRVGRRKGTPTDFGAGAGFWLRRAGRLHLFVNAFVDDIRPLIEIFARAALFGSHPALPGGPRMRHWLTVRRMRRPGGLDSWSFDVRRWTIRLAGSEHKCTASKKRETRGKEPATDNCKRHTCIPDIKF